MDNNASDKKIKETKQMNFAEFELKLRTFSENAKSEDRYLLDEMKQAIIVFAMAEKFGEDNEIFLKNNEYEFETACRRLSEKYTDFSDDINYISRFVKEYYINNLIGGKN